MKLKMDRKFVEELTRHFKIGLKNLTIFDLSTRKSPKFSFEWAPFEQSIYFLSQKKYRGVIFHETEEGYKICRGIDLFQNWHKEFENI